MVSIACCSIWYQYYRNDDYSNIKGTWIRSAKSIQYHNNQLCANLRTYKYNTNDGSKYVKKYAYKHSCMNITDQTTRLMNNNGNFESETSNIDYSHTPTYPNGDWDLFAQQTYEIMPSYIRLGITYFPNAVCAFFHTGTTTTFLKVGNYNHTTYFYNEDCIEYDTYDYLTVVNGEFVIV